MRSFHHLRFLRHLALAAALLLGLAPTVSRVLTAPGLPGGWAELCTMTGLKSVWVGGAPAPAKDGHYAGDCAYCPLLGALVNAAPCLWQVPPLSFVREVAAPSIMSAPLPIRVGHLGARGPPSAA